MPDVFGVKVDRSNPSRVAVGDGSDLGGGSMFEKKETMCWSCAHAVPTATRGCEWSRDGEPVPWWTATDTSEKFDRYKCGKKGKYYNVRECPKYLPEEPALEVDEQNTEAIYRLADAIVISAATDYKEACKQEAERMNEYFDQMERFSVFYTGGGKRVRPSKKTWRKARTEPWAKWCDAKGKPSRLTECEVFFTSEHGIMVTQGNPAYIMDKIRANAGLPKWEGLK